MGGGIEGRRHGRKDRQTSRWMEPQKGREIDEWMDTWMGR